MIQGRHGDTNQAAEVGGTTGGVASGDGGGATDGSRTEEEDPLSQLSDDSRDGSDELSFSLPGYHGNEAELELGV